MLKILGYGAVTNVGMDALSSILSIRAGIQRQAEIRHLTTFDPDDLETPLFGCPVSGFTDGFYYTGAWIRLGLAALQDLDRTFVQPRFSDAAAFWERTVLYWALPSLGGARIGWPAPVADAQTARLNQILLEHLVQPPRVGAAWSAQQDHAAVAHALPAVHGLLCNDHVDHVVVLATDSLLDIQSLNFALESELMAKPDGTEGFLPGEAAGALLFGREQAAGHAQVMDVAIERGEVPRGAQHEMVTALARLLEAAILKVFETRFDEEAPFVGDLYWDASGVRLHELVLAEVTVRLAGVIDWDRTNVHAPGESVGEIGAAFGALNLSMVTWSFQNRAASAESSLVLSLDMTGTASAVLLGPG